MYHFFTSLGCILPAPFVANLYIAWFPLLPPWSSFLRASEMLSPWLVLGPQGVHSLYFKNGLLWWPEKWVMKPQWLHCPGGHSGFFSLRRYPVFPCWRQFLQTVWPPFDSVITKPQLQAKDKLRPPFLWGTISHPKAYEKSWLQRVSTGFSLKPVLFFLPYHKCFSAWMPISFSFSLHSPYPRSPKHSHQITLYVHVVTIFFSWQAQHRQKVIN